MSNFFKTIFPFIVSLVMIYFIFLPMIQPEIQTIGIKVPLKLRPALDYWKGILEDGNQSLIQFPYSRFPETTISLLQSELNKNNASLEDIGVSKEEYIKRINKAYFQEIKIVARDLRTCDCYIPNNEARDYAELANKVGPWVSDLPYSVEQAHAQAVKCNIKLAKKHLKKVRNGGWNSDIEAGVSILKMHCRDGGIELEDIGTSEKELQRIMNGY